MFYQHRHFGTSEYFCKEYGRNFNFPNHLHRSFELISVNSGSMTVVIDGERYILEKGETVLIFPNQLHSLESSECEHVLIIFSPEIVAAYYNRHTGDVPTSNKISLPKYLIDEIDVVGESASTVRKKALLYSVCAAFDEQAEYRKGRSTDHELIHLIFEYIEKNYTKECSLGGLHNALGYSESYLSRYFSNSTGISFVSFVNRYRINRACYLLKNANISILECAMDCGYSSLRSFNRNFLMYVGMTPREYREYN